jgi:Uma2 family endonuclease
LEYLLRLYRASHPNGSILDKTLIEQFIPFADSRRRADRAIWVGLGRGPDILKDVPAIVVEFVSKRKRDRVRDYEEKKREYLAIGVAEYWVIDRFARTMTVFKNTAGQHSRVVVQANDIYQTPLLPGFDLPLRQLFAAADDWATSKHPRKAEKSREQPN